jgi:uncharacterized protein (DUF58 family)
VKVDRQKLARFAELRLRAPGAATSLQQGDRRSSFLGRGLEFADYREYDPGDDIRLIDWTVYLRLQQVLVRQFNEERSLSIKVCVDTSGSMDFGRHRKADRAAQLAAVVATVALSHRDPVMLVCYGSDRQPVTAKGVNLDGMAELLHVLEKVEPHGRGNAYAQLAGQLSGRTDRLFLISDLLAEDAQREQLLRLLAASSLHPVLLHVVSDEELEPDLSDVSRVIDAETGEELVIEDGHSAEQKYAEGVAAWLGAIESRCRTLGIQYLRLTDDDDLYEWIHGDLRKAKVVEHGAGGNH